MEEPNSINSKPQQSAFLFKLTFRSFCFLFLMLIVFLLFYIAGNYQEYLDTTQHFILILCSAISIALLLFCIAGLIESVVYFFILKKKRYWIYFAIYLVVMVFSAVILFALRMITFVAAGL